MTTGHLVSTAGPATTRGAGSTVYVGLEFGPPDAKPRRVRVFGRWTFGALAGNRRELAEYAARLEHGDNDALAWDLTGITALDDAGAVWLCRALRKADRIEVSEHHRGILEQASEGLLVPRPAHAFDPFGVIVKTGESLLQFGTHLRDGMVLLGHLTIEAARLAGRPREIPLREISANVHRAGVTALPVTMLVGFLIGIVLTYLSALQLKRYGADMLVINIVGVGVLRELGPMLASIIAAGRSGSAMTAQLGVMRVTEEIEALSVMGVSVNVRLVLPKVIGLAIALPLVAFATDIAALTGAMLVSKFTLGITPAAFLQALPRAVEAVNFWVGIGKSVVFGFAVAFVACHCGLRVLPNTDSLAAGVTRSVVSAITLVIVLDAIFAVMLRDVG